MLWKLLLAWTGYSLPFSALHMQMKNGQRKMARGRPCGIKIPAKIAPIKLAIFPLLKKDGLPEIAKELMNECKQSFHCFYEEKDAIGKRYRRMDAIGTPFCVTIDHQTKEDNTVTIRYGMICGRKGLR